MKKAGLWIKTITKIIVFFCMTGTLICLILIGKELWWMKDNGWSFNNEQEEIVVDSLEYEEGMAALEMQDMEGAEEKLKEALNQSQEEEGNFSPVTAAISMELGNLYLEEGRYEEAYELFNSAYVTFKNRYGENDGNTILAKCHIALYDLHTDDAEKSLATLNDAYEEVSYIPYKFRICRMLARCHTEIGNYARALAILETFSEMYSELGTGDQIRMELNGQIGDVLYAIGDYENALAAYENAKQCRTEEDLSLSTIYLKETKTLAALGREEEAQNAGEKALDIRKKRYGQDSLPVALVYEAMASLNDEENLSLLYQALDILLNDVGENHSAVAAVYTDIGDHQYEHGNIEEAIKNHEKALEIRKNILGLRHNETVRIYEALMDDYLILGEYEKAAEYADKALEISETIYGNEVPSGIGPLCDKAVISCFQGKGEEALSFIETAIEIYESFDMKEDGFYADIMAAKALTDPSDEEYRFKALEIYQKNEDLFSSGKLYLLLGDLYRLSHEEQTAESMYDQTKEQWMEDYPDLLNKALMIREVY